MLTVSALTPFIPTTNTVINMTINFKIFFIFPPFARNNITYENKGKIAKIKI
jgi:hypothetical protein